MTRAMPDLADTDLSNYRLIVLNGVSGCGKSTVIRELLESHPAYKDRPRAEVCGGPIDWGKVCLNAQLVVIDEMQNLRDVNAVARLLLRGHQVLAASHVNPIALFPLRVIARYRSFYLDRDARAIGAWLDARGVSWSEDVLARFHQRFAGSFTDAEIVLEYAGGHDFDRAFDRFTRSCVVRMTPQTKPTLIRVIF